MRITEHFNTVNRFLVLAGMVCLLSAPPLFSQTTYWRGGTSTAWNLAANWSAGIPTAASTVIIGDQTFTNQPAISTPVTVATLTFNSARACSLTIAAGGTLTVTGNVGGTWTANRTHLINIGAQAMTINGSLTMGSTTSNRYRLNTSISTGTLTILGNLTLNNGSTFAFTGAGNCYIGGNFTGTGTFTRGTGTVTFNGTGAQTVVNKTYYSLVINKTAGTATLSGSTTVNTGTLAVSQGTLNIGANTLTASGNLLVNGVITGTGPIALTGVTRTIDGTGSITTTGITTISGGGKTILGTAKLNFAGRITISTGITVANNGTLTTSSTLGITGAAASATWVNGSNSVLNIAGPLLATGTLTATAAPNTVNYNGTTAAQTIKSATYHNLTITKGTFTGTLAANTILNGNLTIASGILNCATYTLAVSGNVSNAGTLTAGPTVTLTGTNAVVSGAGTYTLNDVVIGGAGVTSDAATRLGIAGNLSTTGAGTFTCNSGGISLVTMSGAAKTISGTGIQLDSVLVSGSVTMNNSMALTGGLNVSGAFTGAAGTTLTMSGTGKTISGAGTIILNTLFMTSSITTASSIRVNGNLAGGVLTASGGTVTFNGAPSTVSGTANLYNVTVNAGTTLQSTAGSMLGIANIFTLTGSFDVSAGNNTVSYNGSIAQNIISTTYDHLSLSNGNTKTALAAITVNGNLSIGAGTTFSAGTSLHTVQGNWTNNGTFTAGSGSVQFTGASDAAVGGSSITSFNTLTINKSASTNTINAGVNINAVTLNVTSGNLTMGSNTVTITGTRTGNGIITGTITHTHAFTAGTAYSFEGPDNTVTFSTVGTVSSVSITVEIGSVGGFPFSGSINRKYTNAVTGAGYTAVLRLHYLDGELNGNSETTMQLWRFNGASWTVSGRTANNTTNNWIEQSGLVNITNAWTISDDQNVVRWNGGSSAWAAPGNWTIVQGTPSTPPSPADIAQLGTSAFANQPTISAAVTVKEIDFGSAQAVTLTLAAGSLIVNGNIAGQWSTNATHLIDAGSQSLTVSGNLILSDGTSGHAMNLNVGSGTVSVSGSLTQSGAATITLGSGSIFLGGDFLYTNGTFTPGTSTVTYNSAVDQIVGSVTYNNLTISKSGGTANINSAAAVNGDLVLSTGGTLSANADLSVKGNMIIGASTTMNANSAAVSVGGNWVRAGVFNAGSSTVVLNGTGNQAVGATTFSRLVINKPGGTASPNGAISISGNLTDSTGILDLGNLTADRTSLGGLFRMGAGATLRLSGPNNFPSNYAAYSFDPAGTVEYYGAGGQTVRGSITYGSLAISTSGTGAALGGSVTLGGHLKINSGAALNCSAYTITDYGNWSNDGSFAASTGTVQLSGAGKSLGGNSSTTFNDLTVSGSYTAASGTTVNGKMTLTSSGSYAAGSTNMIFAGDVANSGSLSSGGIVTFNGTQIQNIALNSGFASSGTVNFNGTTAPVFSGSSPPQFNVLNIGNTAGISPTTGWTVNGAFTVSPAAAFNGGAAVQTFNGTFTNNGMVTSAGGTLLFNPSSAATITLGPSFSSTGIVELGGSGLLTIIGNAPSISTLTISNTNGGGLTLPAGWTIGADINIETNAIFNGSSYSYTVGGSWNSSGIFSGQASTVTMTGTGEAINGTGSVFNNLIIASGASITANSDFSITGNFIQNGTFDATGQDIAFSGSTPSTVSGTSNPITFDHLSIQKISAAATLAQNVDGIGLLDITGGTLDVSTFTVNEDPGLGTLQIDSGCVLRTGGTNILPAFTTYAFDPSSTVEYYGSGSQNLAPAPTYGNLLLTGAGTKTVNASLSIAGDVSISSGTPVSMIGSIALNISGNWQNAGSFSPGPGTVQFDGTGKTISGTSTFNNLAISGVIANAGTIILNGSLNGSGQYAQAANADLTLNGNSITVGIFDASAPGNTVTYSGTIAQSVFPTTYFNLSFDQNGLKTVSAGFSVSGDLTIKSGSNLTINTGVVLGLLGRMTTAGTLTNNGRLVISD